MIDKNKIKMKKKIFLLCLILIIVIFISILIFNKVSYALDDLDYNSDIEKQREAVVEVAKAYFRKGINIQYDSNIRRFDTAPEQSTEDNMVYSVCSHFVHAVYKEALGIDVPLYTQWLLDYGKAARIDEEECPTDDETGKIKYDHTCCPNNDKYVVMYYTASEYAAKFDLTIKDDDDKIATDVKREVLTEILYKLKPGDILTNSGHTMMVLSVDLDASEPTAIIIDSAGGSGVFKNTVLTEVKFEFNTLDIDGKTERGAIRVNDYWSDYIQKNLTKFDTADSEGDPMFSIIRPITDGKEFSTRYCEKQQINITDASLTRLDYPDIDIEKLGSKNTKSYVNFNDEITYTIKINNTSNRKYGLVGDAFKKTGQKYNGLIVTEEVSDLVEVIDVGGGTYADNKIMWTISLNAGESKELSYTVKVKENPNNYKKEIKSIGYVGNIKSAEIVNTIGYTLSSEDSNKLVSTIDEIKDTSSKNGLDFVEEVYNKALGIELNLLKNNFITNMTTAQLNDGLKDYAFLDLYNTYTKANNFFNSKKLDENGKVTTSSCRFQPDCWHKGYDENIKLVNPNSLKVGDFLLFQDYNSGPEVIYLCMGKDKFLKITEDKKDLIADKVEIKKIFSANYYNKYFVVLSPALLLQNNLSNIKVNGKEIDGFSMNKLDYTLNVDYDVSEVNIDTSSVDPNVTLGTSGIHPLVVGENKFTIESINDVGNNKTYTLNIIRNEKVESNYSLNFDNSLSVDIENKYIKYLVINTTVDMFFDKVNITGGTIKLFDIAGNEKNNDKKLATGDRLKVYSNNVLKDEYNLSVLGDSSGDGFVDLIDLSHMRKHIVGWVNPNTNIVQYQTGVNYYALDFNKDNVIDLIDLSKMRKIIVGME